MTTATRSLVAVLVGALLLTSLPMVGLAQTDHSEARSNQVDLQVNRDLRGREARNNIFYESEIIVKFVDSETPSRVSTNGRRVNDLVREYRDRDDVVYAEPNYTAYAFTVPNDPFYSPYQWNFDNSLHGGVGAETAWETTTGEGIIVAVIDTGVAYEDYRRSWFDRYTQAPDLAGTNFVPGYDFVNNDEHANDDAGHGTHVAGTIAGTTNNDLGVAGLAYGASIMPIKVLDRNGSGSYADVADGIRFAADNGADVINLSLGGPSSASYLEDAVCYAKNKGVTVVAAAGNDGANSISYPAAYDNCVIAVGATRFDETKTDYSNSGSSLDLMAPGGDIDMDQNNDGYSDGVLQQTFGSNPNDFGYYFYQGTSMASPHVAAAAALVLAAGKANTPNEVQALLQNTADDLGPTGFDNNYGHGLINLAAALGTTVAPPNPDPEPEPDPTPTTNELPIADAGPDQTLEDSDDSGAEAITLDGTGSYDPDGNIISYLWTENSLVLSSSSQPTILFEVGTHTITLEVTDDTGSSSTDTVDITIEAFIPPPPPPPAGTVVFYDGFEAGLNNWTQDNQNDWQDSRRNHTAGNNAAEIDGRANDALLISPNVTLDSPSDVAVSFDWLIERGLDSGEYLAVDVSTDGGSSWNQKAILRGNIEPENTWLSEEFTFSNVNEIRVRFRGTMSGSTEDAYVDEVTIETI